MVGTSSSTLAINLKFWDLDLAIGEFGQRVTITNTSRENTCNALAQVVMLPRDVANLAAEDEVTIGNLTVMQNVQAFQRSMENLQCLKSHFNEMKKSQKNATALKGELKKTKEDLVLMNTTFSKESKTFAEVAAIAMEEVTVACQEG